MKRIMFKKKSTFPSLRNQDLKTVKAGSQKVNELLTYISTNNIKELSELIYAGAKFVWDKIDVPLKNTNRNSKPGWEIRLEREIRNLRQQVKIIKR